MHASTWTIKSFAVLLMVAAALLCWTGKGHAQAGTLEGVWRQTKSNAGECRTCQLSVERRDDELIVTSNNGWSANIRPEPDELHLAAGAGRWKQGGTSPHSGKFFRIQFVNAPGRLLMIMLGRGFRVEAEFERKPFDSI